MHLFQRHPRFFVPIYISILKQKKRYIIFLKYCCSPQMFELVKCFFVSSLVKSLIFFSQDTVAHKALVKHSCFPGVPIEVYEASLPSIYLKEAHVLIQATRVLLQATKRSDENKGIEMNRILFVEHIRATSFKQKNGLGGNGGLTWSCSHQCCSHQLQTLIECWFFSSTVQQKPV